MNPNTTCDIYRAGSAPPSSPAVAAVPILLSADFFALRMQAGEGVDTDLRCTHVALFPAGTDVRDGFDGGVSGPTTCDRVYVPDQGGTRFLVRFVLRLADGTRRVYLDRDLPPWPSDDL